MSLTESILKSLKENDIADVNEEYIVVSDSDPQNEDEYFDSEKEAIKYAKENNLDRVIRIDYEEGTEEVVWESEEE